jgi:hypothetical protein
MRRLLLSTLLGLALGALLGLPRAGRALDIVPCDSKILLDLQSVTVDGQPVQFSDDVAFFAPNVTSAVHEPAASLTSTLWDPDLQAMVEQSWQVTP